MGPVLHYVQIAYGRRHEEVVNYITCDLSNLVSPAFLIF